MSFDLLQTFEKMIRTEQLIESGDRVLLAVSGGPDSMALLHLFHRWKQVPFGVFHLNHQFRKEADEEEEYVRQMAEKLQVPHHIYSYNVDQYLEISGESKQAGARHIRYKLLNQCCTQHGYTKIALGHHKDDQAETVLMHFLRGAGLAGLAGMLPIREHYIRPLLNITKNELVNYCQQFGVKYYEDLSNQDPQHLRNKVRLHLIPLIETDYNPQFTSQLSRLAQIAQADEAELSRQTERLFAELTNWEQDLLTIDRLKFNKQSIAFQRRLLQMAILRKIDSHQQADFEHIEKIRQLSLAQGTFNYQLPQLKVIGTAKYLVLGNPVRSSWEPGVLPIPGKVALGDYTITTEVLSEHIQPNLTQSEPNVEYFALNQLKLPLIYRRRQPGDRIQLFGHCSSKKVKDILIDAKLPLYVRDEIPIICDQEEIILIGNLRRSEKGRITVKTNKILRITVENRNHCH